MNEYQPLWSLSDYERFLSHPEQQVRFWAKTHLEDEYPDESPHLLKRLVNDSDPLLQFAGINALGALADAESEATLLQKLPELADNEAAWAIHYLAKMHSAPFLPILMQRVRNLDLRKLEEQRVLSEFKATIDIKALGEYDDSQARQLLWDLANQSRQDGLLIQSVLEALLAQLEPQLLPRLLKILVQLKQSESSRSQSGWKAIAQALGLERLFEAASQVESVGEVIDEIRNWWDVEPDFSEPLAALCDATDEDISPDDLPDPSSSDQSETDPARAENEAINLISLFQLLEDEFQRTLSQRAESLASLMGPWRRGEAPDSYVKRTLYTWQLINTIQELVSAGVKLAPKQALAARNLALIALVQTIHDEHDEQHLASATGSDEQKGILLEILASKRENVLPDVVKQVSALGPVVIPRLGQLLSGDEYYPKQRALSVITTLARQHPGAADSLITPLIELLVADEGDFINEGCEKALFAIGPAVIKPLAARLSPDLDALTIYGCGVIGDIPVQASVDTLENFIIRTGEMDAGLWEQLAHLGQLQSLKLLRRFWDGQNPRLAYAMREIGLLHNLQSEEMDRVQAVLDREDERRANREFDWSEWQRGFGFTRKLSIQPDPAEQTKTQKAAQKVRKEKRKQAKATKKAQKKGKKKR